MWAPGLWPWTLTWWFYRDPLLKYMLLGMLIDDVDENGTFMLICHYDIINVK